MEKTKRCYECSETKPLNQFHRDRKGTFGRHGICRLCARAYYRENRERLSASQTVYNLQNKYGITLSEYNAILEAQGGGCAICGKTPKEGGRRLDVDHDHETGKVRGLLCNSCNLGVGNFRNSSELCEQAALYLRLHEGETSSP